MRNRNLFVLLEHTRDGVDTIGVYPTKGIATEARENAVKARVAAGGPNVRARRAMEVIDTTRRISDTLFWYTIHPTVGYGVTVHRLVKLPGREKTTGRFATREELIERVEHLYWRIGADMSQEAIGKSCGVSQSVVCSLLNNEIKERRRNK